MDGRVAMGEVDSSTSSWSSRRCRRAALWLPRMMEAAVTQEAGRAKVVAEVSASDGISAGEG